jgi:dTDP-4-amino-4,6-dideoxygalactose transaminase
MVRPQDIEAALGAYLGRRHCFLVGRGTTAIHLALRVIEELAGRGDVILPTLGCASLAQVVASSGFRPVFADIRLEDFTLDVPSLLARITPETRAILPVHLYGHAAAMPEILALAAGREIFVIEDAAQALGGVCGGRRLGSLGDFSVLSFGGSKIVSVGHGGVVATDSDEFATLLRAEMARLPPYRASAAYALKSLSHRNLYHALVDLLRADGRLPLSEPFRAVVPYYDDLYVHAWGGDEAMLRRLEDGLRVLDEQNAARLQRAARYHEALDRPGFRRSEAWRHSGVVWRYTFLVEDPAALLAATEQLRRHGLHASNHYWSLADLFDGDKGPPNTAYACPRLLNLWVDDVADERYIERTCAILRQTVSPGWSG